jgi:hypothetical protein
MFQPHKLKKGSSVENAIKSNSEFPNTTHLEQ